MYLLGRIVHTFILQALLFQIILGKKVILYAGQTTYEYNDEKHFALGSDGRFFKGERIDGESSEVVAFKVAKFESSNKWLNAEKNIYDIISGYDSIPKFHHFFPEKREKAVLVIELLGENLYNLLQKHERFSTATIMKIGLQVLDTLEYVHKKGVIHYDVHWRNLAVGLKNNSRIFLLDFDMSKEYKLIDNKIVFKDKHLSKTSYKIRSPRNDIKDLSVTLISLIHKNIQKSFTNQIWKKGDNDQITSDEFDENVGFVEFKETLLEFSRMSKDSKHDLPDYEAFRNLLSAELEKHKDNPNNDKFEWQITDRI